jgi:SPP1 family predicted phage head-tail adaptor
MKYTINAGELDRKVTVQQDTGTPDEFGQIQPNWTNLYTDIPCSVDFMKGGEVWESTQDVGNLTTDFKMRYYSGITPAMRLVFEGENYDIKRVIEVTRRKGYVIRAQWKDNK